MALEAENATGQAAARRGRRSPAQMRRLPRRLGTAPAAQEAAA